MEVRGGRWEGWRKEEGGRRKGRREEEGKEVGGSEDSCSVG